MAERRQFTVDDALELATHSAPAWSAEGTHVGYLRFRDGDTSFVARPVPPFEDRDVSLDGPGGPVAELGDASTFDWRPDRPNEVAVVRAGDVGIFDIQSEAFTLLVSAGAAAHASPAWAPDGSRLAYLRDETLWVHDVEAGSARAISAARVADLFDGPLVEWSDDGRYLATLTGTDEGTLALTVYDPDTAADGGEPPITWERSPGSPGDVVVDTFGWAGDRLVYAEDDTDGTGRVYRVVRPDENDGPGDGVLSEDDERGLPGATFVGHEAGRLAVVAPADGQYHVFAVDLERRRRAVDDDRPGFEGAGVTQVTDGSFEARGDAYDEPAWDDAGDRLAYVTNEHDAGERRLHVATLDGDGGVADVQAFETVDGNTLYPDWGDGGDRIACLRAGRTIPADVHVFDASNGAVRRVSEGHPDADAFAWFPEPEPVSIGSSADGSEVRGYLYVPPDAAPGDDRPAVVWAHGGPVRQMRRGFHHMRSYAFFHAFDHVLVDRGYLVLELNYRGGIGYGREYEKGIYRAVGETDVADCVDAAAFLRSRPDVGDRVGLWGLSYGGYLAAAIATGTDAFDCAVDFAGVWDWSDWVRYATSTSWGAGRRFIPLFGGHPDEDDPAVAERYERASPSASAADLATPLYAIHGTDDPNVPFEQMDTLVSDLVDDGRDFEMAYYPEEDHMFERSATWRDALGRVLPFLDEHLRPDT